MQRHSLQDDTAARSYDLVVVGGGATGLGVALDASLRGLSVALFESNDFASGTSSRATKLLHGGVRYLAQGNIALVREALAERKTIIHIAPHLAQPLAFVMPSKSIAHKAFYGIGLKLYDLLAGKQGLGATTFLSQAQTDSALPGMQPTAAAGGVKYWDGQFDDARLAVSLATTAQQAGAVIRNHTAVTRLTATPNADHRFSIELRDTLTGDVNSVTTQCVVNAAGVWVDTVRQLVSGDNSPAMVTPSQGVHLVVSRDLLATDHALLIPKTDDGRVLFTVPWLGSIIVGTTDTPRSDAPREPKAFDHEVDFILREVSKLLIRPVTAADVKSVWVGLRPLVKPLTTAKGGTKTISREHTIVANDNGLITVTGGKWTTYRVMAEEVIQSAIEHKFVNTTAPCSTATHRLLGAPNARELTPINQAPGPHLFGTELAEVNKLPGANNHIGMGLTEAMVRYCVQREFAVTVEDMLARRWRSLFLDARVAKQMAPQVATILQSETAIDPQLGAFEALCDQYTLA
jgi:glycerol-3-phosphate dehydrogenase